MTTNCKDITEEEVESLVKCLKSKSPQKRLNAATRIIDYITDGIYSERKERKDGSC